MKTYIDRALLFAVILGAAAVFAPPARAAEPIWTHAAGACVIDKTSDARALVVDAELRYENLANGEIIARCNVVNPKDDGTGPLWKKMDVVYKDTDGPVITGPGNDGPYRVLVTLKRVTNGGAPVTVGVFDSNIFPPAAVPVMRTIAFPAHVFSFAGNAYWIEIKLKRAQLAGNASVFLVRLHE